MRGRVTRSDLVSLVPSAGAPVPATSWLAWVSASKLPTTDLVGTGPTWRGTVRRVCRNVKRWRNAAMALRWTAAGMMEAAKGFRRLKAYKHLPLLRVALAAHQSKYVTQRVEHDANAA